MCRTHAIVYQGFSLLTANREVFVDPAIRAMAEKYGTGVSQVVFRFAMQVGMVPLTGTTNLQHMADDLRADQFTLTPDEVERIETIGM
jgi:diketogulonate reductase-like aldo/keto reductase